MIQHDAREGITEFTPISQAIAEEFTAQTVNRKGELELKLNKLLIPLAALLLIIGAAVSLGAQPKPAVQVPAGNIVDSPNASSMVEMARKPVPEAPALPDAAQPDASITNFDGSSLEGWQSRNGSESGVTWVARDGRLWQTLADNSIPNESNALFVSNDSSFADGSVETYFYATAGSPLGVVLRGSDAGYYRVLLYLNVSANQISKAEIQRVTIDSTGALKAATLAKADWATWPGYDLESWTLLKATATGNSIAVSINGREVMSATDGTAGFAKGWAGVWTQSDQGTQFDNIRIQRLAGR